MFFDGSCSANGQAHAVGGYGVWIPGRPDLDISEPLPRTEVQSNNRGEMRGALGGIRAALPHFGGVRLTLNGDSTIVVKGLTQWKKKWLANGWKRADGQAVVNVDLWKQLDEAEELLKAAGGHLNPVLIPREQNSEADRLARRGTEKGYVNRNTAPTFDVPTSHRKNSMVECEDYLDTGDNFRNPPEYFYDRIQNIKRKKYPNKQKSVRVLFEDEPPLSSERSLSERLASPAYQEWKKSMENIHAEAESSQYPKPMAFKLISRKNSMSDQWNSHETCTSMLSYVTISFTYILVLLIPVAVIAVALISSRLTQRNATCKSQNVE